MTASTLSFLGHLYGLDEEGNGVLLIQLAARVVHHQPNVDVLDGLVLVIH